MLSDGRGESTGRNKHNFLAHCIGCVVLSRHILVYRSLCELGKHVAAFDSPFSCLTYTTLMICIHTNSGPNFSSHSLLAAVGGVSGMVLSSNLRICFNCEIIVTLASSEEFQRCCFPSVVFSIPGGHVLHLSRLPHCPSLARP